MAIQPHGKLWSLLGLVAWGDLGPLTFYRRPEGRLVAYGKTWPETSARPRQLVVRANFKAAIDAWHALTAYQRAAWTLAARRASLCMTGYNMFLYWTLTQETAVIRTIEHQTGVTLLP